MRRYLLCTNAYQLSLQISHKKRDKTSGDGFLPLDPSNRVDLTENYLALRGHTLQLLSCFAVNADVNLYNNISVQ